MDDHWKKSTAALAVAVAAITVAVISLESSTPSVYAIDRTLAAIDQMEQSIETVHFAAELYKQGNIECWMRFDGDSREPTHMCMMGAFGPVRKIDKPEGSFAYNKRTNRVRKTSRDERNKSWHLDFARFFRTSLRAVKNSSSIQIGRENDAESGKEMITIRADEGDRICTYFIDPETELPIRFTSTEPKDLMKYLRPTFTVKNMKFIEYNKPIPEGMFDIPADATLVTNEHDIVVHPGIGLDVTGQAPERACIRIINEVLAATNTYDFARLKKLHWPCMIPPKSIVEQIKTKLGDNKPIEKVEMGEPYQKGDYWYVRCVTTEVGNKIKRETVPIKFYEFDGRTYCLIAWPD